MAVFRKISDGALRLYRMLLSFFEKCWPAVFLAAVLVLAFYCFRCLDVQYVDSWDEARHGVNAYEMLQNDDYIVHTYNYETDYWNLKPSISYWGIILGFRIFGYSVTGLRFTSALAYLITGVLCALFAKHRFGKESSILVLLFFCANERPLSAHLARAGDADSLFLLFFTAAVLSVLLVRENHRFLYVCGLSFSLAFLTKSWHAFMIAAVAGLCLLVTGDLFRQTLKRWLLFLASVFAPLILWFGRRFTEDGFYFLRQMIEVDLLSRTTASDYEGHGLPFSFYWEYIFGNEEFIYRWLILIFAAGIAALVILTVRRKNFSRNRLLICDALCLALWFLVPFLGFSLIGTKLIWYCYPCTVPLIIGSAAVLGRVLKIPLEVTESEPAGAVSTTEISEPATDATEPAAGSEPDAASGLSDSGTVPPAAVKISGRPRTYSAALPWLVWAAAAGTVALTCFFMWNSYLNVIREAHGDSFQLFIQASVDRDSDYAGLTAYVYVAGEDAADIGTWDQNMLFVAEISGDFHCADGGVEAFLEEEGDAVLYISAADYESRGSDLQDAEVLYEDGSYVLLVKYEEG